MKKWYINLCFLTLAGFVNAAGVTLFLVPWKLIDGGLSGTSFVLSQLTGTHLAMWLVLLNFPFFLLAWKKMGKSTVMYSLYAIAMYALATFLFQSVFKLCGEDHMQSPFVANEYDIILAALFGGLISGMGSGLTIRFGGAMDGIEVMGVMFAKKVGMTIGQFVMVYNALLYVLVGFLFKDFQIPLYSIIAYAIGLKAVDFIVDGLDKGKAAFIITDHPQQVGKAISDSLGRGITVIDAHGYYSKKKKAVLYCIVNRFEISVLKNIIHAIDAQAFVAVSEVSDMYGSDVNLNINKIKKVRKYNTSQAKGKIAKDTTAGGVDTIAANANDTSCVDNASPQAQQATVAEPTPDVSNAVEDVALPHSPTSEASIDGDNGNN